jgi:hypothetical protein
MKIAEEVEAVYTGTLKTEVHSPRNLLVRSKPFICNSFTQEAVDYYK